MIAFTTLLLFVLRHLRIFLLCFVTFRGHLTRSWKWLWLICRKFTRRRRREFLLSSHGGEKIWQDTQTHIDTHRQRHTSKFGFLFSFFRYIGLMTGCLLAGKVYQKVNQYLYFGVSLFLMGTCVFVAPFCGNVWSFLVTMILHGFSTGFITVGKLRHETNSCLLG